MSKLNVLRLIALSYAQLQSGRTDTTIDSIFGDEDEDLVEEIFEGDPVGWVIGEVLDTQYLSGKSLKWAKDNGLALLEQEGGGEGGGEYCHAVFSWQGKIYKVEYSYYSYDGHNYEYAEDTLKEVRPVEKLVTVYE